jgi:hypothetical protein
MTTPRSAKRRGWYWLLLLPVIGLAFPVIYAKTTPTLFGFPFFYWYQFAWLFISAGVTWVVYRMTR